MFHALAKILSKPVPLFSQLVHNHLLLFLKEFERYFPSTKNPKIGKECICNPFVNKPRESSMFLQKEDQLFEIANDDCLKLRLKQQLCRCSGIKPWWNTLRSQPHHLKPCCHFRRPICVKRGFLK